MDRRDVKKTLPLHSVNGDSYYLGVFLVGAYQEIPGDLHNLFGDTHAVHVSLDENGSVRLDALIKGDTVREVLDYWSSTPRRCWEAPDRRRNRGPGDASTTKAPAGYSASTKTACTATRTWKSDRRWWAEAAGKAKPTCPSLPAHLSHLRQRAALLSAALRS